MKNSAADALSVPDYRSLDGNGFRTTSIYRITSISYRNLADQFWQICRQMWYNGCFRLMEMSEQLVSMTDRSGCKYRSTEGFTKTALESAVGWLFLNNLSASRFMDVDLRTCSDCVREIHRLQRRVLNGTVRRVTAPDGQESLPFGSPCRHWCISAGPDRSR